MNPQETSTAELADIAKQQAASQQEPEQAVLHELQVRYGWTGCPKEDLVLIADLDRSVLKSLNGGNTQLPPRIRAMPGAKPLPVPVYYQKKIKQDLTPMKISLDALRCELNDAQRKYLNLFWKHYLDYGQWPSTFDIHRKHDPDIIYEYLHSLSGDIVREGNGSQGDCYELSLAGILLTKNGKKYQNIRVRMLELLRKKYFQNKKDENTNGYSDEEIGQALKLNEEERRMLGILGKLDHTYPIYNHTTGGNWTILLPTREIQKIPRIGSLAVYHDKILLRFFKRETPVFTKDQHAAQLSRGMPAQMSDLIGNDLVGLQNLVGKPKPSDANDRDGQFKFATPAPNVSFVSDAKLKSFAETVAKEACRCFDIEAFNSAAVMAGSATEAVLLDLLLKNTAASPAKLNGGEPLEKWRLADLIKEASKLNLLGKATGNLAQQVKEHRNLIHPGRSLREKHSVGRGEAEITIGILRLVCDELT